MSMSKKDYVNIANILRVHDIAQSKGAIVMVHELASSLADYFERDNERFDRDKFVGMSRTSVKPGDKR